DALNGPLQRQALADHLTRLLDKLGLDRVSQKAGPASGGVVVILPDNGRGALLQRTTNGQDPTHTEIGTVKILPRDADEFIAPREIATTTLTTPSNASS